MWRPWVLGRVLANPPPNSHLKLKVQVRLPAPAEFITTGGSCFEVRVSWFPNVLWRPPWFFVKTDNYSYIQVEIQDRNMLYFSSSQIHLLKLHFPSQTTPILMALSVCGSSVCPCTTNVTYLLAFKLLSNLYELTWSQPGITFFEVSHCVLLDA